MKTACYLRVSTTDQTTDNQLPAIQDFCKAHWWPEPVVYSENESAWRSGRQTELQRLLEDNRNGQHYDVVVVWSLDRLSRQGISHLLNLIQKLKFHKTRIVSIKEPWADTAEDNPMADLLLAVFAFCAKLESDKRSINTKAGLARARSEGKSLGRPKGKKDGYKRSRRGYLLRWADDDFLKKQIKKGRVENVPPF